MGACCQTPPLTDHQSGHGLNPGRVARARVHRNCLVGLRDDRTVAEGSESWTQVGGRGRVAGARSAMLGRHGQHGRLRHAIEVKPRVQIIIPREPLGPERNLVSLAIRDAAAVGVSRLKVVVQGLGAACGYEMQDVSARVVRIRLDSAMAVSRPRRARPPTRSQKNRFAATRLGRCSATQLRAGHRGDTRPHPEGQAGVRSRGLGRGYSLETARYV